MGLADPDALMAYEATQQRLIEGISSKLHRATDENYRTVFAELAVLAICELVDPERPGYALPDVIPAGMSVSATVEQLGIDGAYRLLILRPICRFAKTQVERDYLLQKVLTFLIGSFTMGLVGAYTASQIAGER